MSLELLQKRRTMMMNRSSFDWQGELKGFIEGDLQEEFVFPQGITKLRRYALAFTSFTSIHIPDTVQATADREYYALSNNTHLTELTIGSGLTRLDEGFLTNCTALQILTIPAQVNNIAYIALRGCSNLKELILEPTTPPTLGGNALANTHADLVIYVPDASVNAYKTANNWSSYASKIKAISERP